MLTCKDSDGSNEYQDHKHKYYYVDFGLLTYFPPSQQRGLVTGLSGHDRDVPKVIPYIPFKVDIFILGNMLRTLLIDVCPLPLHAYPNT